MKIFLIIVSILLVLFSLFQIYLAMSIRKTETQLYNVIRLEKGFEIRFYPAVTMATITSSAKTYKELANSGFRKLATYIFGGNEEKKQIAMTSPVHMNINDSLSSMSFVMPQQFTKDNLPRPKDSNIIIETTEGEYVAAIKFGGYASDRDIKFYSKKLEDELKEKSISYYGNFRLLGYNPPFQFFGRRNEIIINVNWDSKLSTKTIFTTK
jgi:hypothetical protein